VYTFYITSKKNSIFYQVKKNRFLKMKIKKVRYIQGVRCFFGFFIFLFFFCFGGFRVFLFFCFFL